MEDTRNAVLTRLAALERAACHADPSTLLPLARTELHRLADGWRRLLATHRPGPDGRCEACRTGIRAGRWPCQVWRAAHEQLIGDGVPHRRRTHPVRNPFRRR
jgi:hypothetical protein